MRKTITLLLVLLTLLLLAACGMKQQSVSLNYGETTKVELDKEYPDMTWSVADEEIVSVSDGKITGVAPGKTTVTVMSKGKPVVEIEANVNIVEITGIFLNQSSLTLNLEESSQLKYSLVPDNASDYGITWKTVNEDIAKVTEDGTIQAKGAGTTTIICSSKSGVMGTCEVTVLPPSAIELLNDRERRLFEYMTQTMLPSFYNASAVRIRNIYGNTSTIDTVFTLDIQGTNKLGGTLFKQYMVMILNDKYSCFDISESFNKSNANVTDKSVMDYSKINAALEEYWSNSSIR